MNSQMGKNKLENVRLIMYLCTIIGKEITDEDLNGDPEQSYAAQPRILWINVVFVAWQGNLRDGEAGKNVLVLPIKNPQMEKCVLIELYQHGHMAPFRLRFTTCQSQSNSKLHP